MEMLRCFIIVVTFAVLTKTSPWNGYRNQRNVGEAGHAPVDPAVPPTAASGQNFFPTNSPTSPTASSNQGKDKGCGNLPSPGECQAAFPRYYYNSTSDQCDCYLFGGCVEDIGSYKTLQDCHQKCQPSIVEEGPQCHHVFIDDTDFLSPPSTSAISNKPMVTEPPFSTSTSTENLSSDPLVIAGSGSQAGISREVLSYTPAGYSRRFFIKRAYLIYASN